MSRSFPLEVDLSVTDLHIKHGRPRNANFCPVALAAHEEFNDYYVRVNRDGEVRLYTYPLSSESSELVAIYESDARDFIELFDKHVPVEPRMVKLTLYSDVQD